MRMSGWRKPALLLAIIFGSGLAMMPVESRLVADLRAQGFHPESRGAGVSERVGVQGAIGLLGGMRYMVAAFLELEAFRYWEPPPQWDKLSEAYGLINLLQPRNVESWENAAWHHLYNASGYYRHDERELPPLQREVLARDYERRGMEILKAGIEWNPDNAALRLKLAHACQYKLHDYCEAAEAYRGAAELPDAPAFCFRFYGYSLAKCPGKEREAYAVLRQVYGEGLEVLKKGGPMIWKPTLIVELNRLEKELGIPWPDRVPERFDGASFRIASPLRPRESYPVYRALYERAGKEGATGEGGVPDPQLIRTIRDLEEKLGIPGEERLPAGRVGNEKRKASGPVGGADAS